MIAVTVMARVDCTELLDLFCWGMDKLSRPTLRNLLAGYDEYTYRQQRTKAIWRAQQAGLIARSGRAQQTAFAITANGLRRIRVCRPDREWNKSWDGAWRVITFDLPESQRGDRKRLWQALRARKLGMLQRSVWIWPHDLKPILTEIVRTEGLPECFCGFTAKQLFLCTDAEVVASAWNWEEIFRRHDVYARRLTGDEAAVRAARQLPALARAARVERQAFDFAFLFDPLLPKALLPKGYRGREVWERHVQFRKCLGRRLAELSAT
jgi:phenylacetic acid degradation operon negative regulatory protein